MSLEGHRVLVVEDDPALLRGVSDNFRLAGCRVETAMDGEQAISRAESLAFDLIVLDVMLPKVNGYEVCRYLRQEGVGVPILFLTAKVEEPDILLGFGLGADDYVAKPFRVRELLARANAVLRRSGRKGDGENVATFRFGLFSLDRQARRLRTDEGEVIRLSPKEYDLLDCFLRNRGRALSRERIMSEVWGAGAAVAPRSIDRFVTQLRRIIETEPGEHIETIREYGYRFRSGAPRIESDGQGEASPFAGG